MTEPRRMSQATKDRTGRLYPRDYKPGINDPHYGATSPLEPERCCCESPWIERQPDGEVRCWKCGRAQTGTTDT